MMKCAVTNAVRRMKARNVHRTFLKGATRLRENSLQFASIKSGPVRIVRGARTASKAPCSDRSAGRARTEGDDRASRAKHFVRTADEYGRPAMHAIATGQLRHNRDQSVVCTMRPARSCQRHDQCTYLHQASRTLWIRGSTWKALRERQIACVRHFWRRPLAVC
jgi:hypothetical protein